MTISPNGFHNMPFPGMTDKFETIVHSFTRGLTEESDNVWNVLVLF